MSKSSNATAVQIANLRKAIAAVPTKLATGATLCLDNTPLNQAQLSQQLEAIVGMMQQVISTKQAWAQAKQALSAARPGNRKWLKAFRSALEACFGADNPVLDDFGFKPEKQRAKATVDELAQKVANQRATKARKESGNDAPPSSGSEANGSAKAASH